MLRIRLPKLITTFICTAILVGSIAPANGAIGDLDTDFGTAGKVTTVIVAESGATSMALQSDGKIVVVGNEYNGNDTDFAVARYNTDGSLDTSFSADGKLTTFFNANADDYAASVKIQSDGKIVVVGETYNGTDSDFAIARFNTNGSLDTTFMADFGGFEAASSIFIQADGKYLVAGYSLTIVSGNFLYDFMTTRFSTDGTLDVSFGTAGKVVTDISSRDVAKSLAIQSDGKFLVAGESYNGTDSDFTVVRYNTNGSIDSSFGSAGVFSLGLGSREYLVSIALQSDGKIVAAGTADISSHNALALVRINANGSLDTGFGTAGKVTTIIGVDSEATSMAIQSDGKIVVAGLSYDGGDWDFGVARFTTDGSLDTDFGNGGKLTTAQSPGDDSGATSVVIQSDGKIIVAGYSDVSFALARYIGSESTASAPSAPTLNSVSSGDRKIVVSFTAGADNGAAITDYEYSLNGGSYVSAGTTTSPITITGLNGRTSYAVTIKARNSAGLSTASSSLSATTTDASLDSSEAAARVAAEAVRVAAEAAVAQKAKEQKELTEILSVIPSIAGLALNLGDLTNSLIVKQKCVKGKTTKYVKKGAKCPKGYSKKK
jgi:uncharacterized delta-60 repeat protein